MKEKGKNKISSKDRIEIQLSCFSRFMDYVESLRGGRGRENCLE